MLTRNSFLSCTFLILIFGLLTATSQPLRAQDRDDEDPPGRAARLGHLDGSVSFQPAGESEWVEAVPNRPMTTGDKLWADRDSRARIGLGSATIYLSSNTGVSFLNLDDRTVQLQLSAGTIDIGVRHLDRDEVFEIDTPNQAFSVEAPGRYRLEASENGDYTVVSVREGDGESTGNGQTYRVHQGQRATFSGTNSLNADVEQIGAPDQFDDWAYGNDRRYEDSRSARYCSHDMVGYEDLDEYGDWRPSDYGNVWYPNVAPGWAPYREGHWAWIDPWGWTWVDSDPWGYAPFHYGRWSFIEGRWGWIPGPVAVAPVFAPALVVFVGGGGPAFGENVAWFPLGPREVYVPSYRVSEAYVNRVNISNTTVNQTTITNVYNTTIVHNNTNITNVNYVNRNVNGAVTAVPQRAFVSAQPVAKAAVPVNQQQLRAAPVSARVAVAPTPNAVLGAHASTAGHVAAPPQSVVSRPVIAKTPPPPPPPAFSQRQQALAAHPGQPIPRAQLQKMAPPQNARAQPQVRIAPPGRPATPNTNTARPGNPPPPNRPENRPAANERPGAPAQPNRPEQPNQPAQANRPFTPPARNDRPPSAQPGYRPEPNAPATPNRPEAQPNRPAEPPTRNERPPSAQPGYRPEPNAPPAAQPEQPPARSERPPAEPTAPSRAPQQPAPRVNQNPSYNPPPARNEPPSRPQNPAPNERQQQRNPPPAERPAPPPQQRTQPPPQRQDRPPQRQEHPPDKQNNERQPPGR